MKISVEKLTAEAEATGFRPDVLEKVAHLLGLLDAIRSHPFLKGKLVLKGGTALNLFIFDVPRLSVDIDLNYVGAADRETMLTERPKVEQALQAVFSRENFNVRRMPEEHAGGKWSLRYESAPGRAGNLEVDLNFMFRVPLWPVTICDSHSVGTWRATGVAVLDSPMRWRTPAGSGAQSARRVGISVILRRGIQLAKMATPMPAIMTCKCTIAGIICGHGPASGHYEICFIRRRAMPCVRHAAATKKGQAAGSLSAKGTSRIKMERAMGFEPTTFSLGS